MSWLVVLHVIAAGWCMYAYARWQGLLTERPEEADLVEPPEAVAREPLELADDPLARRLADAAGVRPEELFGGRVELEPELVLEAHGAQEPQRVVGEDRLRDGAKRARSEVLPAPERVDWLAALEGHGDRVDGEVAAREIFFERAAERREVDCAPAVEGDAPRAVPLAQRERRAAGGTGEAPGGLLGLGDRHVEVDERPPEQLVAHGAADYPRVLAGQHLANGVTHRRPSVAREWMPSWRRSRTRARS